MQARDVCKWYNVCPMKRYFKEGKLDIKWIDGYCRGILFIPKLRSKRLEGIGPKVIMTSPLNFAIYPLSL